MKKMLLILTVIGALSTPALANLSIPSLGWWDEYAANTTHQYWEFTNATNGMGFWTAIPEDYYNPVSTPEADIWLNGGGVYNKIDGYFIDPVSITVKLYIENYEDRNKLKEIWVDVGQIGTLTGFRAIGVDREGTDYIEVFVPGPGPRGLADFGYLIYPNPEKEDIWFTILAPVGGLAVLDYIHADTICIPAPGAILLGGIGVVFVGWLRRRRTILS